jgi:hypothetical protein
MTARKAVDNFKMTAEADTLQTPLYPPMENGGLAGGRASFHGGRVDGGGGGPSVRRVPVRCIRCKAVMGWDVLQWWQRGNVLWDFCPRCRAGGLKG